MPHSETQNSQCQYVRRPSHLTAPLFPGFSCHDPALPPSPQTPPTMSSSETPRARGGIRSVPPANEQEHKKQKAKQILVGKVAINFDSTDKKKHPVFSHQTLLEGCQLCSSTFERFSESSFCTSMSVLKLGGCEQTHGVSIYVSKTFPCPCGRVKWTCLLSM